MSFFSIKQYSQFSILQLSIFAQQIPTWAFDEQNQLHLFWGGVLATKCRERGFIAAFLLSLASTFCEYTTMAQLQSAAAPFCYLVVFCYPITE